MTTSPLSATDESHSVATQHLTVAWFAKRSALWLLTVAAGIGAACMIYAYAEESDGAELRAQTTTQPAALAARAHP